MRDHYTEFDDMKARRAMRSTEREATRRLENLRSEFAKAAFDDYARLTQEVIKMVKDPNAYKGRDPLSDLVNRVSARAADLDKHAKRFSLFKFGDKKRAAQFQIFSAKAKTAEIYARSALRRKELWQRDLNRFN